MKKTLLFIFCIMILGVSNFANAGFVGMTFNCQMKCGNVGSNGCYGLDVAGEVEKSADGRWIGSFNKFIFAPDAFELNTFGKYDYAGILNIDAAATLQDNGKGLLKFEFEPGGIQYPQTIYMEGNYYDFPNDYGWRTNRFSLNMQFDKGTNILRAVTADVNREVTGKTSNGIDVTCKLKLKIR